METGGMISKEEPKNSNYISPPRLSFGLLMGSNPGFPNGRIPRSKYF